MNWLQRKSFELLFLVALIGILVAYMIKMINLSDPPWGFLVFGLGTCAIGIYRVIELIEIVRSSDDDF